MATRLVRRSDLAPRVEMIPLIDVIFLLLTFFIYSLLVMVRADILPVTLLPLGTGQAASPAAIHAITIDQQGRLFFDREPVTMQQIQKQLGELSRDPDRPTLYLAMEAQSASDRGPVLINLIELVRAAGIDDFVIVGQPKHRSRQP